MKDKYSQPTVRTPKLPKGNDEGGRYVDNDIKGTNPLKEQFEPTDAEPVRQHFKMAGGC